MRNLKKGDLPLKVLLHFFLCIGSIAMLFPFIWLVSNSFKTEAQIFSFPPNFIPPTPNLDNFKELLAKNDFLRWYLNSIIVVSMRLGLTLFFSSLGGFALAKYDFPLKKLITIIILASMIIPFRVLIIPMFLVMHRLRLLNTHIALILPWVATPFGIFMMRQYLVGIPDALIDAARVDGATGFWIYRRIILPLGKAGLGALSVVLFVWTWTSFLWPLIVLFSSEKYVLTIGMANMIGGISGEQSWGATMAGASLATIPILIIFGFVQKYFVRGLTIGALR